MLFLIFLHVIMSSHVDEFKKKFSGVFYVVFVFVCMSSFQVELFIFIFILIYIYFVIMSWLSG